MAESIKITGTQAESLDQFGREHSDKLQVLGRGLVSGLYMLIRSVKMYDPDNEVFQKPLASLQNVVNQIIAKDGKLELVGVQDAFYLNNMLLKVDLNALDNVRYLMAEMRSKDVGGFSLSKQVQIPELKNFVWIFAKEQAGKADEDGIAGRKLLGMKVTKFSKLKEKLQNDQELDNPGDGKVDRKKYAMTVYARALFFLQKYIDSVRAGKPIDTSKALRIIQDLVDISYDQKTHFLGMTTMRNEADYLLYHQVNVCLMAIVFGAELGLTKAQLRDLGYIALFHDAGMATIPEALASKRGSLTPDEKALIAKAPLVTVRNILMEKGITRTTLLRAVSTFEHKADYGSPVRDARGNIQAIVPKGILGAYSRILAICDTYDALTSKRPYRDPYGPEVALMLMWTEMRHRFDPELLKVFMRVMAIQPVKVLSKKNQALTLGGL